MQQTHTHKVVPRRVEAKNLLSRWRHQYSVPAWGEGVLTDKWYTGMLKGFEVHFRKFWYMDGWVIVTYPMRPICKIGCILENLAKKAPNLSQIGCFLQKNGIEMGHKIMLFEV